MRTVLSEVEGFAARLAREADGFRPPSKWSRVSGSRPKPVVSPVGELLEKLTGGLLEFEDRARVWRALVREDLVGLVDFVLSWRMVLERLAGDEPPERTPTRCRCGERRYRVEKEVPR
ncbi:hypothetical protein ACWEPN_36205 [Nonomuraea wenchangensis]